MFRSGIIALGAPPFSPRSQRGRFCFTPGTVRPHGSNRLEATSPVSSED
jgi:hypothetical protein